MKIVIDARMINWTGVGRYTQNLLKELQQLDQQNQYQVVVLPDDVDVWRPKHTLPWQPMADNFSVVKIDAPMYHPFKEQFSFGRALKLLRPDLVHFTNINRPAFYRGTSITTIHDLQMLDPANLGSWYKRYKLLGLRMVANRVIKNSRRLIVPLEHTRDQLTQRFPAAKSKTEVVYEAASEFPQQPQQIESLAGKHFLLYVGNAYPHKNLARLLQAFSAVAPARPELQLVLAGKLGDFEAELKALTRQLSIDNRVIFLGFVSDGQLAWLYQQTEALILPSLSEGFGLQALEAMIYQAPIVAANNGAYSEVCEEAALYFDPMNPEDMALRLNQLLASRQIRQNLIRAGQYRIKNFSWAKTAHATLDIYYDVFKQT